MFLPDGREERPTKTNTRDSQFAQVATVENFFSSSLNALDKQDTFSPWRDEQSLKYNP